VRLLAAIATALALSAAARAAPADGDAPPPDERAAARFQLTVATQAHPAFSAPYTGRNSMRPSGESATSVVTDLFLGARAWPGAEVHLQPELSGGRGLSSTLGVAAFPSGEVYRIGNPEPTLFVGRAFLRQTLGLGGGRAAVEADLNRLAGAADRDRLTVTVGKFSVPDVFDAVSVASDPHTRFMSWGLFASAAYDYPADTRGYTWGAAVDLALDRLSFRAGAFLEPRVANQLQLEWDVAKARGLVAQVEERHLLAGRRGALRVLAFLNDAHMGSYRAARDLARATGAAPDVTATRAFGREKAGLAASVEQDLGAGLSAFARASFDDGRNETWAFTEIDRSLAAGAVQSGARWGRPDDEAGLAVAVSGLSALHRKYLAAGGLGFLIGDGALRYGLEVLGEAYYRFALTREIALGANYQPIFDPAFNRDRGPVHVFTGRVHVAL
jgi:high affinity Mn2+ porin